MLTLQLSSAQQAPAVGLWVDGGDATVREATVEGRDIPVRGAGPWGFGFIFTGAAEDGVVVRLVLEEHEVDLTVRIVDRSDDLRGAPDPGLPVGRVLVTPRMFITRELTL